VVLDFQDPTACIIRNMVAERVPGQLMLSDLPRTPE
jgi:hypothetical protein